MNPYLVLIIEFLARYLHIVCSTLLVGGTLFYEMVVPVAIDELRPEQQLLVFARARWVFKSIVWVSAIVLLFSGVISTRTHWRQYNNDGYAQVQTQAGAQTSAVAGEVSPAGRAGWWWVAHASTGILAVIIALSLTIGKAPPAQPIRWMRLNLVILLLVMFLATATRQARLHAEQRRLTPGAPMSDVQEHL